MKIFIDAGHNDSGYNTGAEGNGLREQDVTFSVAKLLSDILTAQGIETKLSRPTKETNVGTDNSSSINTRYTMANSWGADYFISIHCNAGGGSGAETLYYKDNSEQYASVIQQQYVKAMGIADRGIKYRDNIGVLRYTNMPAVLIELGFIDNAQDAAMLRDKQPEMAQAIANGFYAYLGITPTDSRGDTIYHTIEDLPAWAKPTITKLVEKNYLSGSGDTSLNLTPDMVRVFVVTDRAGLYDQA